MIDFIGIGAQKAGTTWLYANLSRHPGVWTPLVKEIHFFDVLHAGYPKEKRLRKIQKICASRIIKNMEKIKKDPELLEYLCNLPKPDFAFTDEWYKYIFSVAPEAKCTGEVTPFYSAIGRSGIEHMKNMCPDVRLIYMIRDPFDRAVSSMRMQTEGKRSASPAEVVSNPLYRMRGDYMSNIPLWDEYFGDQVLYIPFGNIKTQPAEVMAAVERHLKLRPFNRYPRLSDTINSTNKSTPVAPEIIDKIRGIIDGQTDFLRRRFGDEFVKAIK